MANLLHVMAFGSVGTLACGSVTAAPLIQMDFNDAAGNASLENRGSLDLDGKFMHGPNNENTTGADYAAITPPINSGGYSVQFKTTSNNRGKVSLGDVAALDGGLSSLTLTAWINRFEDAPEDRQVIFSNAGASNSGWSVRYESDVLQLRQGATNRDWTVSLPRGEWIFIALTFDASKDANERLEPFLGDGNTLTSQGALFADDSLSGNGAEVATIGNGPGTTQDLFRGYIDNLRVYDTNESANLQSIMQANDVIPEPATLSLAVLGLALVAGGRR